MKRREFIAGLGSAAAWPLAARAQQGERLRQIGILMGWSERDAEYRTDLASFVQEMVRLGWVVGKNLHIEQRWTNAEFDRIAPLAKELVEQKPDAILAGTTPVAAALHRETNSIPIVFVMVADPVGAGFVAGLSRPGGNTTGFINIVENMGGKWLGLLKEITPGIKRVALMFNPDTAPGGGTYYVGSFQAGSRLLETEPLTVPVRSDAEIEAAIASLGGKQAGLIVNSDSFMGVHRGTVISSALRYSIPTIMDYAPFVRDGGLISYGPSNVDMFRRAAGHVDRVLRGAKPADLPVELPTKFEMAINLKTAKTLGIAIPPTLLALADEVIE
jgi:putative tryptophan/tyrosine transport system substrate-binding protein